jgi:hypothetical protein
MLSTLDKYCLQTVDEIHAAAVAAATKGTSYMWWCSGVFARDVQRVQFLSFSSHLR